MQPWPATPLLLTQETLTEGLHHRFCHSFTCSCGKLSGELIGFGIDDAEGQEAILS